jgi:Protein of unknown function (DUF2950)
MRGSGLSHGILTQVCVLVVGLTTCIVTAQNAPQRTFASPDDAVKALIDAVKSGALPDIVAIFGRDGQELASSSDEATGRRNRQVFAAAASEGWRLVDEGQGKVLVIGREAWPFPVPLVKDANGWRFDTAAGKEEVLARRIGRNELAVIQVCRTYVAAQRLYASRPHDGKPAGLFAQRFSSTHGKQDGLYWPSGRGQKRSPLGDLVAQAAEEGRPLTTATSPPQPFHGYYFRILTAQGPAAPGGAKNYVVSGDMSAGFALVAWPAEYDVTGVMTFVVNRDGVVYERDLGPTTRTIAPAMTAYDPGQSWAAVQ